jgi:hypothetical protein
MNGRQKAPGYSSAEGQWPETGEARDCQMKNWVLAVSARTRCTGVTAGCADYFTSRRLSG